MVLYLGSGQTLSAQHAAEPMKGIQNTSKERKPISSNAAEELPPDLRKFESPLM
ncbi:2205_t:CDS:2 [Rhizophagus irregularis]|nr:2205_t:CDS:2 [Rhizophagus irregularis]